MVNFLQMNNKVEKLKQIAEVFVNKKRYFDAVKVYDLLIRRYKRYDFAFELSRTCFLANNITDAIYFGEQWLDKIKDIDIKIALMELLAFCYMRKENYLKVNEYFGRALELTTHPEKKLNLKILYAISFDQIGKLEKAVEILENLRDEVVNSEKELEVYLNLISLYDRLDNLKKALEYADYILENYDEFEERFTIFTKKIDFLLRLKKIEEAQRIILQAREMYEENSFGYQVLTKLLQRSYTIQAELRETIKKYKDGGF